MSIFEKNCRSCKHYLDKPNERSSVCNGCQRGFTNWEYKPKENDPRISQIPDSDYEHIKAKKALDVQEGGQHYKSKAIQPIVYIHANNLGFCEGNVVKYITRHKEKNGIEDLKKAKHYIDLLIELEYNEKQ